MIACYPSLEIKVFCVQDGRISTEFAMYRCNKCLEILQIRLVFVSVVDQINSGSVWSTVEGAPYRISTTVGEIL